MLVLQIALGVALGGLALVFWPYLAVALMWAAVAAFGLCITALAAGLLVAMGADIADKPFSLEVFVFVWGAFSLVGWIWIAKRREAMRRPESERGAN